MFPHSFVLETFRQRPLVFLPFQAFAKEILRFSHSNPQFFSSRTRRIPSWVSEYWRSFRAPAEPGRKLLQMNDGKFKAQWIKSPRHHHFCQAVSFVFGKPMPVLSEGGSRSVKSALPNSHSKFVHCFVSKKVPTRILSNEQPDITLHGGEESGLGGWRRPKCEGSPRTDAKDTRAHRPQRCPVYVCVWSLMGVGVSAERSGLSSFQLMPMLRMREWQECCTRVEAAPHHVINELHACT